MVPPWRINEVLDRAKNGPFCREKDFDMKILWPKLREAVKDYDIKFDPENIVPSDDSLADDVWMAGYNLYLETGTLCKSTNRRILFDEEEVKEALALHPRKIRCGFGKDSSEMFHREIEDKRRPFCFLSPDITCDEEIFIPMTMAYLQEPIADGVCAPILEEIEGRDIKVSDPFEVKGSIAHAMMFREAARRVGRPGLFLKSVGTAISDAAQIAASNQEWGERLTDSRFVASIAELKTDFSLLNKMVHFHEYGCYIGALFGPMKGGYCGGPEGTAIVGVAHFLQGLMVNQAHWSNYFPIDIRNNSNTSRELLWVVSVTYQAVAKNSPFISTSNGFASAGPCTPMVLYEAAVHGLVSVVSGGNLWEIGVACNKYKNRTTPMEARMACEVGLGAAKEQVKREDANLLAKEIVSKYEKEIDNPPLGKTFQECYDIRKVKPSEEYIELYRKIKKELEDLGVPFLY